MVLVDPHVKVFDGRIRDIAVGRGLDAVVYAPHFTPWPTIVERAAAYSSTELTVVPGRELFTGPWYDRKHVLALDLEAPVPDFLGLEATMEELGRQDAAVIAPHPGYMSISLDADDVVRYRERIHAVEVYNPKFLPWHGHRARSIADRVGRPGVASSYAHLGRTVGAVATELACSDASASSVIDALRSGSIAGIERPRGAEVLRWTGPELGHLVWENSGKKLARAARPGRPATHVSQDPYERFRRG